MADASAKAEVGKALSRQVGQQAQGKVAVLLACCCQLPLVSVEFGEEGVAGADSSGQLRLG